MMSHCDIQPVFYTWSEPIARKEHKCCECGTPILKGEKHFAATGKWECGVETFRQHLDCCAACMFVRDKMNDGECIGFGELFEFYQDCRGWISKNREPMREFRTLLAKIVRRQRKGAKK